MDIYNSIKSLITNKKWDINAIYKSNKKDRYIFTLYEVKNPDADLVDNMYLYDSAHKKIRGYTLMENPSELNYALKNIIYSRKN